MTLEEMFEKAAIYNGKTLIERQRKMQKYLKETNDVNGGVQFIYKFENRWGASVIRNPFSYGGDKGLWEVGILNERGNLWSIEEITGDDTVIGYLTWEEVMEVLEKIKNYKWNAIPKSERHYVEREFDIGVNAHFESETIQFGQGLFSQIEISKSYFRVLVKYARAIGWLNEEEDC